MHIYELLRSRYRFMHIHELSKSRYRFMIIGCLDSTLLHIHACHNLWLFNC